MSNTRKFGAMLAAATMAAGLTCTAVMPAAAAHCPGRGGLPLVKPAAGQRPVCGLGTGVPVVDSPGSINPAYAGYTLKQATGLRGLDGLVPATPVTGIADPGGALAGTGGFGLPGLPRTGLRTASRPATTSPGHSAPSGRSDALGGPPGGSGGLLPDLPTAPALGSLTGRGAPIGLNGLSGAAARLDHAADPPTTRRRSGPARNAIKNAAKHRRPATHHPATNPLPLPIPISVNDVPLTDLTRGLAPQ
ncbi:hypothetical protein DP939_02995 [Spongiactinospora rosea]|uniref:Uncharacterized protein n=1 Tax=Spongiactinospora rosea TaxID=2248750 RepID=A0A366M7V8_9ACTN|nr:hypothetical protein [Spongiactinospora rosea]RBQ21684.1 hypothetical protein DP939_02995 [Spongiactinospora rosea]